MNYAFITNNNGKVVALYRTGQDIVKNEMTPEAARKIIESEGLIESDKEGYIHAGNWYFEGNMVEPIKKVETSSTYGTVGKKGRKNNV